MGTQMQLFDQFNQPVPPKFMIARSLACKIHGPQTDDGGAPYMQHVVNVVNYVAPWRDPIMTLTALLHDTVERAENPAWVATAIWKAMPNEVQLAVGPLTRIKGEPYDQHLARVIDGGRIPVWVKLAEIEDNMKIDRLKNKALESWALERHERYREAHYQLSTWLKLREEK